MLGKINPFGTWKGTLDTNPMVVKLSKAGGSYTGELDYNGSHYGPTGVQLCDYGGSYSVIVYGYEAMVTIISKTKITITFNGDTVTLKKQ